MTQLPREIDLGPIAELGALPARVVIDRASYYLTSDNGAFRLLSTTCPHQGGEVADTGSRFQCPNHDWTFDRTTGACLNVAGHTLASFPVFDRGGRLIAVVPNTPAAHEPRQSDHALPDSLTIQLHGHACLEITCNGFSVLTDPWLAGPAFLGAWYQYPSANVDPSTLRPDAIVITHEHSDHFHEFTLTHFAHGTPVYVPDFPNQRMQKRLAALGFTDVRPLAFGKAVVIHDDIRATCYEPESSWNDSITLLAFGGFRLLNINDAGVNPRIAAEVGPVDAISVSFSIGASGYPLTWTHLTEDKKTSILERAREGRLIMLEGAAATYGAKHLIPFASYFTLWHPQHRAFVAAMHNNTIDDVINALAGTSTRVVDIVPGESWNVIDDSTTRREDIRDLKTNPEFVLKHLEGRFDEREFARFHPQPRPLPRQAIEQYFLRLSAVPEIVFCEEITVLVQALVDAANPEQRDVVLQFRPGSVSIAESPASDPAITITIPSAVLNHLIANDESWDEAHIGYWCRFSRTSDNYHANFWRLLQAPYFAKPAQLQQARSDTISSATIMADVVERQGIAGERILRRYGLHCTACPYSTTDSVLQAGKHHGLDAGVIDRLLLELNAVADS